MNFKKGQVSVGMAIVGAVGMIVASAITAWATTGTRVNDIETQVSVVETTEALHYTELNKRLDRIESKLDQVLKINGTSK
jgi:hypothetical protein